MPLHEYKCESCGVTFEVIQKFSDPVLETCRSCGGKVRRLLSAPAIHFKGTGWYITDYARKGMTGTDQDKPLPTPTSGADHEKSSSTPVSGTTGDKPAPTPTSSSAGEKPSASSDAKSSTPSAPATTKS